MLLDQLRQTIRQLSEQLTRYPLRLDNAADMIVVRALSIELRNLTSVLEHVMLTGSCGGREAAADAEIRRRGMRDGDPQHQGGDQVARGR